jgi:hypothetical protein
MPQNIITFPTGTDQTLVIGSKDRELAELIDAQAQVLYRARSIWIGGLTLPWGMLSAGQREFYRREIEVLVKGED